MKKLILVVAAALMAAFVGCKSIPSDGQMYNSSYTVGVSTGLIANMTKIDDVSRSAVVDIIDEVDSCIPATNETFSAAWTPIAEKHIAKLIEDGKIDAGQGILIAKTFDVVVTGIDYLFNVRYPKARQYQELVESAAHGFSDGFLTVFKPTNTSCGFSAAPSNITYDVEAYNYLKAKCCK